METKKEGLFFYNTLSKKRELFKSIRKGQVGMYVCGPTANDVPHLGHARQQITFDVLRRVLLFKSLSDIDFRTSI